MQLRYEEDKNALDVIPYKSVLFCLIVIGFLIRLYMAHIDPFLHIWDERFHALVSSNMIDHPLRPMLRAYPVLPVDALSWTQGGVWLHKQPLFLWQMALSMKLFGTSVYALRYPSVIMGTLMIPMIYYIVIFISKDKLVGLVTAGLFCFSNFHLELVSGMRSMDHNDLCLEFYVLAGVWVWLKYEETKKWYWVLLVGLFSGAAILTKWLIGLFVYLVWGLKFLLRYKHSFVCKEVLFFLCSLFCCCLVFLPWQFFITRNFPIEAANEYAFNRKHITEVVEAHDGTIFYYLGRFPQLFGEGIFLLLFPGIYLWYKAKKKDAFLSLLILLSTLWVFLFLSIIVTTKVISHLYFIAPFVMMLMAYTIVFIFRNFVRNSYLITLLLLGVFIANAKPEKILGYQYTENEERDISIHNAAVYQKQRGNIPFNAVVVNVPDNISFMFFNKGTDVYEHLSPEDMALLRARQIPVYAFRKVKSHPLPDYILHYPYLHFVNDELK